MNDEDRAQEAAIRTHAEARRTELAVARAAHAEADSLRTWRLRVRAKRLTRRIGTLGPADTARLAAFRRELRYRQEGPKARQVYS